MLDSNWGVPCDVSVPSEGGDEKQTKAEAYEERVRSAFASTEHVKQPMLEQPRAARSCEAKEDR